MKLSELCRLLWREKIVLFCTFIPVMLLSVFLALKMEVTYIAEVVLAPSSKMSGGSTVSGSLSGIASLAGLNLGGSAENEIAQTLAIFTSRSFLERFVESNQLAVPLLALKQDGLSGDIWTIDANTYSEETKQWLDERYTGTAARKWYAYRALKERLTIDEDPKTGLIDIAFEWHNRMEAKKWLGLLVRNINDYARNRDVKEANESIIFLKESLSNTEIVGLETAFYNLIESQTKKMMLAKVKKNYALEIVDPVQIPIEQQKSKRKIIFLLGCSFGLILSVFWVFLRNEIRNNSLKG